MDILQRCNHSASSADNLSRRTVLARLAKSGIMATLVASTRLDNAQAQATPERPGETPNYFELAGDGMEITYAATTLTGLPHLTYRGPAGDLEFSGDEIDTEESDQLGRLVTVLLDAVPDGYTLDLTLLLPAINLTGDDEPTRFATLAILAKHLTTIAGPRLIEGALQTYEAVALEGTARFVAS